MSDPRFDQRPPYRDDLNDSVRDADFERSRSSNAMWGWIAGGVFIVIVLALIFGPSGSNDSQTALDNQPAPNAVTTAPPASGTPITRPGPATTGQGTSGQ